MFPAALSDLQMLSMEMSLSCSYMEGWSFLLDSTLRVDWECSFVTFIRISPAPLKKKVTVEQYILLFCTETDSLVYFLI